MQSPFERWRDRLRHFATAPGPEATLNRSVALLAAVTLVTAWFSETFFFPDEHFQILEFMSYKLGITDARDLPWEFAARLRPWMQPFAAWLIAKPLMAAGMHDMFALMFVMRLASAAVGVTALFAFARYVLADLPHTFEKIAYAKILPFMGFLPYLLVRTSSENLSGALFTLAFVFAVKPAGAKSLAHLALSGLFCGLAFEARYQTAFLSLGLFGWLVVQAKMRPATLAAFAAAAAVPVLAAFPIDRWGYGVWCFPPWNYLDVNVIQSVSAKVFGASPLYAYLYLDLGTVFAPVTAVVVAAMVIAVLRNPRHPIVWATVPFVVVHSLIAHKEERFLFPLAILATSYPVLAFSPAPGRPFPRFGSVWAWRRSIAAKLVGFSAVAAMVFLAFYPFGIRPHLKMARYLYHHFPMGFHGFSFDTEPFADYPMVRPKPYTIDILSNRGDLDGALAKGPLYLVTDGPGLPPAAAGKRATLVYSELPQADNPQWAGLAVKAAAAADDLKRTTPLHPPALTWLTLYRIDPPKR